MFYKNKHDGIFKSNLCCKVKVLNETTVVRVNLLIWSQSFIPYIVF